MKRLFLFIAIACLSINCFAQRSSVSWNERHEQNNWVEPVGIENEIILTKGFQLTATADTQISVAGHSWIVLDAASNIAGVTFKEGRKGQLVLVSVNKSTGSNTIALDDTTSNSLGGSDFVLTEGADSCILLQCVNDEGDEFMKVPNTDVSTLYTVLTVNNNAVVTGTLRLAGSVVDYSTTTTARTVTSAECNTQRMTFTISAAALGYPVTFNLPPAVAGMECTFVDNDSTAAGDLTINPDDSDKINNQTAGVSYNATGDAFGETVTLRAIDGVNWIITTKVGTWGQGS